MNSDQDSGSLADRAAAWVPPWERPADREAADDQGREAPDDQGREAPDDRAREDVGTDPDAHDDADALDREIDADIMRQAGLPGPGTVESDVETEIDLDGETAAVADTDIAAETAAVADTDTAAGVDTGIAAGAEADAPSDVGRPADAGAESDVASDAVADAGPDPTAGVETGAGITADLDAANIPSGDAVTGVAAAVETDTDGSGATHAEDGSTTDADAYQETGWATAAEPDEEPGLEAADAAPDAILGAGPSPLPGLAGPELGAALEAILMVVDEPVTEAQLADVLDVAPEDVAERLRALAADYAESGRGFELRRAAGGWRFYTRAEFSGYVERFVLDGQSARLTQAALETLAVVAYQQPVTRSRISAIRGVNCDGVVRTLVTRGLLEESGTQPETGAYLYRTTTLFLEKLGLDSVDELPPLAPFLPDDVNGLTDAQR